MQVRCYNCGYEADGEKFLTTQGPGEWKFVELSCPQCFSHPPRLGAVGIPAPFKMENDIQVDRVNRKISIRFPSGGAFIAPLLSDYL